MEIPNFEIWQFVTTDILKTASWRLCIPKIFAVNIVYFILLS